MVGPCRSANSAVSRQLAVIPEGLAQHVQNGASHAQPRQTLTPAPSMTISRPHGQVSRVTRGLMTRRRFP